MNASTAKDEVADIVTSLQEEVKAQSEMLYTFIGALQRDAPPTTISGEPVVEPAQQSDVFKQVMSMPSQLMSQSRTIKQLIDLLPDGASEDADMEEILKLQQESNELDVQLEQTLAQSEDKLLKAQTLFDLLGKHNIHVAALQQASTAPAQSHSGV